MNTIQCAHPPHQEEDDEEDDVMRRMGTLDCLHGVPIYLYYALCFMLVQHSVCHEPISVLINVFMLLA